MAKMGDFIAFQAAVALLKDTKQDHILTEAYDKCKAQEHFQKEEMQNFVRVYEIIADIDLVESFLAGAF